MQQWSTNDEILAARDRFEAAIPGWQRPAAFGLGRRVGGAIEFVRVNAGANHLPAVILATVCGHVDGPASYELSAAQLTAAIDLLTPAEACTEYPHPNLWAWRTISLGPGETAVAVFAGSLSADDGNPDVAALLAAL